MDAQGVLRPTIWRPLCHSQGRAELGYPKDSAAGVPTKTKASETRLRQIEKWWTSVLEEAPAQFILVRDSFHSRHIFHCLCEGSDAEDSNSKNPPWPDSPGNYIIVAIKSNSSDVPLPQPCPYIDMSTLIPSLLRPRFSDFVALWHYLCHKGILLIKMRLTH